MACISSSDWCGLLLDNSSLPQLRPGAQLQEEMAVERDRGVKWVFGNQTRDWISSAGKQVTHLF